VETGEGENHMKRGNARWKRGRDNFSSRGKYYINMLD